MLHTVKDNEGKIFTHNIKVYLRNPKRHNKDSKDLG